MTTSPYPRTLEVLQQFGIDGRNVLANSVTTEGYEEIARVGGQTLRKLNGDIQVNWMPWPNSALGRLVMDAMRQDEQFGDATPVGGDTPASVEGMDSPHRVDRVVLLRRMYDMDVSTKAAEMWIAAENSLTPDEFIEYQALYASVTRNTGITNSTSLIQRQEEERQHAIL